MRHISSVVAAALLAGCSFALPLTAENATTTTFDSRHSTERTFRNVLAAMRDCYPVGFTVEQTYFPEAKEGEITLAAIDTTYRVESIKLKFQQRGDAAVASLMKRSNAPKTWDAAVQRWIEGDSAQCPGGTRSDPRPSGSETSHHSTPVN